MTTGLNRGSSYLLGLRTHPDYINWNIISFLDEFSACYFQFPWSHFPSLSFYYKHGHVLPVDLNGTNKCDLVSKKLSKQITQIAACILTHSWCWFTSSVQMRSRWPWCGHYRLVLIAATASGWAGEDMQLVCCLGIRNFIILVCTIFLFLFIHTHVWIVCMFLWVIKNSNLCHCPLQLLCWVLITIQIISIFDQISETLTYPLC